MEPPGPVGKPFTNALGGDIVKHGKCETLLTDGNDKVGLRWTACGVTRPLQSVSKTCGPEDGPGRQDFLFKNKIGVVMPPGIVDLIMKHIKPVAKLPRRGGPHVGRFKMSSFPRQGQAR